jgi:hypothetical protein
MIRSLTAAAMIVTLVTCTGIALAGPPPAYDELTEFNAGEWGAEAQYASASVADDTALVQVGSASLRFETDGGFDTWLWALGGQDAGWDLLGNGSGGIQFWVYADNPNLGFQSGSPWVRVCTDPNDYYEYTPPWDLLNLARGQWLQLRIPFNGDDTWTPTAVGNPDLTDVNYVEIHADTWDYGFTLWFDGLSFDVLLAPPLGQMAIAGNHEVSLAWRPFNDLTGTFDHYAVYRATSPFSDVSGLTPLHTIGDIDTTEYVDATAVNGTSYYYAVTAVLSDGYETAQVEAVGPRTPRDETDLQVVSISRTPRYPRYWPLYTYYEVTEPSGFGPYGFTAATGLGGGQDENTQRWPEIGDPVTYTATVRNRGTNPWVGELAGTWRVDDAVVSQPSQSVSLEPGDAVTFTQVLTWDGELHDVEFTIDIVDARVENNALSINTKSVAYLSYVDRSYLEDFGEETPYYPNAATDDFLDWLNRHMARFNVMFAEAGCQKRVYFDVLEVLDDNAPDPDIETIYFAIFPFRYRAGDSSLRHSGYYDSSEDIDFGLLHEMGHQLGLIDLYRLDLAPTNNYVSSMGYSAPPGLMHGCSHFLSQHSALAMNHWLDIAHGYYGQYMYQMPDEVRLRFVGFDGQPLAGATVYVYQKVERPGLGEVITDQIKAQGTTDTNGEYALPNVPIDPNMVPPTYAGDELRANPFGYVAVVGTNGLLHFKVEHNGFVDYAWLDITEVNNAYWLGQTDVAVFERQLALGGSLQCYPPPDMAELNAASWARWAQDGEITLSDDLAFKHEGEASVRIDATGGWDNYVRYPGDQVAIWDLSGVQYIRVWFYAINPNLGFQSGSPWVHLGNQDGFFEWRPIWDVLNQAIGQWVEFVIPIAGDDIWQRSTFGSPTLSEINYIEIHADTWDAGFTLWMDGVRFDPPLPPFPGDLDYDSDVDLTDLATLLSNYGTPSGASYEDGDIDGDGAVNLADLAGLLANYGSVCE